MPANGTEGETFTGHYCDICAENDIFQSPCHIYSEAFNYPDTQVEEWYTINGIPHCSKFVKSRKHMNQKEIVDLELQLRADKVKSDVGQRTLEFD